MWLASAAFLPVGFLYFWTVADEFQIIDMGVKKGYRRKGVAKSLLQKLIAEAMTKKFQITLDVRVHNTPAVRLYEKLGFETVAVRKGYYGDGEDGLILRILSA